MTKRHWWRRLAAWFRGSNRVATPYSNSNCAHASPEATMNRLLLSVGDPAKMQAILADTAKCPGCMSALVTELVLDRAGQAMDAEDAADARLLHCTCAHPTNSQTLGLRLCLSLDDNDDALHMALGSIASCPACLVDVVMAQTRLAVSILNDTVKIDWRPVIEARLWQQLTDPS